MDPPCVWMNTTKDGHYQLPLLWKNASIKLPDSLDMAKWRLESVKRRLEQDDMLKIKYMQEMQRVLDKGYAEVVPEEQDSTNRVWYIPHHSVLNPNKPDKVKFCTTVRPKVTVLVLMKSS